MARQMNGRARRPVGSRQGSSLRSASASQSRHGEAGGGVEGRPAAGKTLLLEAEAAGGRGLGRQYGRRWGGEGAGAAGSEAETQEKSEKLQRE